MIHVRITGVLAGVLLCIGVGLGPQQAAAQSGACCLPGLCLDVLNETTCQALGGTFTLGALCNDSLGDPCVIGACCHQFFCEEPVSEFECNTVIGGTHLGEGSTCAADCEHGACCFPDDHCEDLPASECPGPTLLYGGNLVPCPPDGCGEGCCCFASLDGNNGFGPIDPFNCAFSHGIFQGPGSVCTPFGCPIFGGACCFSFGGCFVEDQSACAEFGAQPIGEGVPCSGDPQSGDCPGDGACCPADGGPCFVTDGAMCASGGGAYQSEGSTCTPDPCTATVGACCLPDTTCDQMTQSECAASCGQFFGVGSSCPPGCPVPCCTNADCTDNNVCNGIEMCSNGICLPGLALNCDDGNACTTDSCHPVTGCVNESVDCDDSDACTTDSCNPATGCVHSTVDCEDGDPCTTNSCDPHAGCLTTGFVCGACCVVDSLFISDCEDNTTQSQCQEELDGFFRIGKTCADPGICVGRCCLGDGSCAQVHVALCLAPLSDGAYGGDGTPCCDDGNACNGVETCDENADCQPGSPPDCDDADVCTEDSCEPFLGCVHVPVDCDDDNACTDDSCDPQTGQCVLTPVDCDDGIDCTVDDCDPATACTHTPDNSLCLDENLCTTNERCDVAQGGCVSDPVSCDDGFSCTDDVCVPTTGECINAANTSACDDADPCTNDACAPEHPDHGPDGCVHGPVDCDDGVACTVDSCDPANGNCVNAPDDSVCVDNDLCTINEHCDPNQGGCASDQVDCDDGIDCTDDSCDPLTGQCVNAPNDAACIDENLCTFNERCDPAQGGCVSDAVNCDDGFSCTDDVCEPVTGECLHAANNAVCADAQDCTVDVCDPEHPNHGPDGCVHAPDHEQCHEDPDIACTDDTCDPNIGCLHGANDANCDDGVPCTIDDCDPNDPALAPSGCRHTPDDSQCVDLDLCTDDRCDATADCQHDPRECPESDDPCTELFCNSGTGECEPINVHCGACCVPDDLFSDGGCMDNLTLEQCDEAFGVFFGPQSVCGSVPCGACCENLSGGDVFLCTDGVTPEQCGGQNVYLGDGSVCAADSCHGACCQPDGSCTVTDKDDCLNEFRGIATACDELNPPCEPYPVGACCHPFFGSPPLVCLDGTTADTCVNDLLGDYQGDGTACVEQDCLATGACCDAEGNCAQLTEPGCDALETVGGEDVTTFLGVGIPCAGVDENECPATGACCKDDGTCVITSETVCDGVFQGADSTCDACKGACCHPDGTCTFGPVQDCPGDYRGDGTDCAELNPPCEPFTGGACCLPDGTCKDDLTDDTCFFLDGAFEGEGVRCADIDCDETGACCFDLSRCEDLTEQGCSARGGAFAGTDTSCDDEVDPCFDDEGACCKPDGSCAVTTRNGCRGAGDFRGEDTNCAELNPPCEPFVPGACCFAQGLCLDNTTADGCTGLGGVHQGNGTTCADEDTDCEGLGACCDVLGGCRETTEEDCADPLETFLGVDSACDGQPGAFECPDSGACCRPDGTCYVATRDSCLGLYRGDNTNCAELNPPCEPFAAGACCFDPGDCFDAVTRDNCTALFGSYQGDGTMCDDPDIDDCLAVGACCIVRASGSFCVQTTEPHCTELEQFYEQLDGQDVTSVFQGVGTSCEGVDQDECPTTGACCVSGIGCLDGKTEQECSGVNDVFLGLGTACATSLCGACCDSDSSVCVDGLVRSECTIDFEGVFQGPNSRCATSECKGACCLADETCIIIEGEDCHGQFRGTGTDCTELNPPCQFFLAGACCIDASQCLDDIDRDTCIRSISGDYQGDFTLCENVDCSATGACCFEDNSCVVLTEAGCAQDSAATGLDAVWLGEGTLCGSADDFSLICPTVGACCFGEPLICAETTPVECAQVGGAFLGLGLPCIGDICECPGGCDDGIDCTIDNCDPASNSCIHVPSNALCDDGVDCTVDECDPSHGCSNTPDDGACNDNDPCTVDSCDAQNDCQHADIVCDDGIDCTADLCDANGVCQFTPSSALCDDGIACTEDICDPDSGCLHAPNDANCNDGDACTIEACDPVAGCQQTGTVVCPDDGNPCTDEVCLPAQGCVTQNNNNPCNDGEPCTTNDTCVNGGCFGGPPPNCDDGDPCTNDACTPGVGCTSTQACNDNDPCTQDICLLPLAGCQFLPIVCPEDGDLCTVEVCDSGTGGCISAPVPCPHDQRCVSATGECVCPDLCGDLDFDDDVDGDDFLLFLATFGRLAGDPLFNVCADYDGDGVISLVDYQLWRQCAIAYILGL